MDGERVSSPVFVKNKKADQVLMMKYETTAFTVHERQSDVMDVRKSES